MGDRLSNALYGLNLETLIWKQYPCSGMYVKERMSHTATAVGNGKIIVYGGLIDLDIDPLVSSIYDVEKRCDGNFYCYDLTDGKWSQLLTTGYTPGGRQGHVAAYYKKGIIYCGSLDLFVLNVTTNHITRVATRGESPCNKRLLVGAMVGSELIILSKPGTFVLSWIPSLQDLCVACIVDNVIDDIYLPFHLRWAVFKFTSFEMEIAGAYS